MASWSAYTLRAALPASRWWRAARSGSSASAKWCASRPYASDSSPVSSALEASFRRRGGDRERRWSSRLEYAASRTRPCRKRYSGVGRGAALRRRGRAAAARRARGAAARAGRGAFQQRQAKAAADDGRDRGDVPDVGREAVEPRLKRLLDRSGHSSAVAALDRVARRLLEESADCLPFARRASAATSSGRSRPAAADASRAPVGCVEPLEKELAEPMPVAASRAPRRAPMNAGRDRAGTRAGARPAPPPRAGAAPRTARASASSAKWRSSRDEADGTALRRERTDELGDVPRET